MSTICQVSPLSYEVNQTQKLECNSIRPDYQNRWDRRRLRRAMKVHRPVCRKVREAKRLFRCKAAELEWARDRDLRHSMLQRGDNRAGNRNR